MIASEINAIPVMVPLEDLRVLLVDDQTASLHLVRDMLAQLGVRTVLTASGGREALHVLAAAPVDAVLCDWTMPEISGLDLLRTVRKDQPDLPFIMVTGTADPTSVLAAKDSGVSGYLKKPFSSEDLRRKLVALARMKAFRAL